MHYNFVRIHQTLRCSRAMEAQVTDHLKSLEDMVALVDEWEMTNNFRGNLMSQPPERPRLAFARCQFGSCQCSGKTRAISHYDQHELQTVRPRLCDEHFRDLPNSDGAVTAWLNDLRGNSTDPLPARRAA